MPVDGDETPAVRIEIPAALACVISKETSRVVTGRRDDVEEQPVSRRRRR